MPQAAELRTPDLPAGLTGRALGEAGLFWGYDLRSEVHGNFHAGDRILLNPHHRQRKTVNHILGGQTDRHGLIDRQMQLIQGCYIVDGIRVRSVYTQRIDRRIHQIDIPSAEYAVRSGVMDIPCELLPDHLYYR